MIIQNSTKWDDNDLRNLFRKCVKKVEKTEKPSYRFKDRHKNFKLAIINTTYSGVRGRAIINGYWIMIKIPGSFGSTIIKNKWETIRNLDIVEKTDIARVMIHEYYHTLGFRQYDKHNYKYDSTKKWDVDWVKKYPIRKKVKSIKPKQDIKEKRYLQAIKNLEKAKTRKKRADTIYYKWKKKVAYYEKTYNFKS